MYLNDVFTQPANIAGIPAISVPAGMSDGLPVGLQFMASHLQEEKLLRAAHAYEQATDWHTLQPGSLTAVFRLFCYESDTALVAQGRSTLLAALCPP